MRNISSSSLPHNSMTEQAHWRFMLLYFCNDVKVKSTLINYLINIIFFLSLYPFIFDVVTKRKTRSEKICNKNQFNIYVTNLSYNRK